MGERVHKNVTSNNLLVGYLSFLTDDNYERRKDVTKNSAITFKRCFENQEGCDVVIINNGSIVHDELKQFKILNMSKNYYDIAVHFGTMFEALKNGNSHFAYVYDDFEYYDDNFSSKCVKWLIENNIKSMRIPAYKSGDKTYNTLYTNKAQNPDAVRHFCGVNNQQLWHEQVGDQFFKTNWQPNSRPMIWNTQYFYENFYIEQSRVLQSFEGHLYNVANKLALTSEGWISSFYDCGVCKSANVETSERTRVSLEAFNQITVNVNEIKDEIYKN